MIVKFFRLGLPTQASLPETLHFIVGNAIDVSFGSRSFGISQTLRLYAGPRVLVQVFPSNAIALGNLPYLVTSLTSATLYSSSPALQVSGKAEASDSVLPFLPDDDLSGRTRNPEAVRRPKASQSRHTPIPIQMSPQWLSQFRGFEP